ncbi:hypothetical protein BT96DRAFT_933121 [Gymnopus androsaceus JB14]|uniref:Uncharacterized protein n=1 Tax=Gymnopus androsaceus JB14 TaxID=1447944 RepID=A0A6A4IAP3_9AGAR|nr:hypothetical protein BT96DRAFT_933121 [Gymnopus androsaceus JB14]
MSSAEVVQVPDNNGVAQPENHDTAFHDLSKSTEDDSKHALNGVEAVTTEHNGHVANKKMDSSLGNGEIVVSQEKVETSPHDFSNQPTSDEVMVLEEPLLAPTDASSEEPTQPAPQDEEISDSSVIETEEIPSVSALEPTEVQVAPTDPEIPDVEEEPLVRALTESDLDPVSQEASVDQSPTTEPVEETVEIAQVAAPVEETSPNEVILDASDESLGLSAAAEETQEMLAEDSIEQVASDEQIVEPSITEDFTRPALMEEPVISENSRELDDASDEPPVETDTPIVEAAEPTAEQVAVEETPIVEEVSDEPLVEEQSSIIPDVIDASSADGDAIAIEDDTVAPTAQTQSMEAEATAPIAETEIEPEEPEAPAAQVEKEDVTEPDTVIEGQSIVEPEEQVIAEAPVAQVETTDVTEPIDDNIEADASNVEGEAAIEDIASSTQPESIEEEVTVPVDAAGVEEQSDIEPEVETIAVEDVATVHAPIEESTAPVIETVVEERSSLEPESESTAIADVAPTAQDETTEEEATEPAVETVIAEQSIIEPEVTIEDVEPAQPLAAEQPSNAEQEVPSAIDEGSLEDLAAEAEDEPIAEISEVPVPAPIDELVDAAPPETDTENIVPESIEEPLGQMYGGDVTASQVEEATEPETAQILTEPTPVSNEDLNVENDTPEVTPSEDILPTTEVEVEEALTPLATDTAEDIVPAMNVDEQTDSAELVAEDSTEEVASDEQITEPSFTRDLAEICSIRPETEQLDIAEESPLEQTVEETEVEVPIAENDEELAPIAHDEPIDAATESVVDEQSDAAPEDESIFVEKDTVAPISKMNRRRKYLSKLKKRSTSLRSRLKLSVMLLLTSRTDATEIPLEPVSNDDANVEDDAGDENPIVVVTDEKDEVAQSVDEDAVESSQQVPAATEVEAADVSVDEAVPAESTESSVPEENTADLTPEPLSQSARDVDGDLVTTIPFDSEPTEPQSLSDLAPEAENVVTDSLPTGDVPPASETDTDVSEDLNEPSSEIQSEETSNLSVNTEIERPKSPWTPSYSVINQGPNVTVEEEDIPEIEQLPPVTGRRVSSSSSQHYTRRIRGYRYEQTKIPSRPSSPWVPSYSVSVQGSPSVSAHASPVLAANDLPKTEGDDRVSDHIEESVSAPSETLTETAIEETELATPSSDLITETQEEIVDSVPEESLPSEPPTTSAPLDEVIIKEEDIEVPLHAPTESIESVAAAQEDQQPHPSEPPSFSAPEVTIKEEEVEVPLYAPTESIVAQEDQLAEETTPSSGEPLVEHETVVEHSEKPGRQETDTPAVDVVSDEQASAVTDPSLESKNTATLSPSEFATGIERPRSPWGSYEVMNQSGSKTPLEEPELAEEVVEIPASFITDEPATESIDKPASEQNQDIQDTPAPIVAVDDSKLTVDTSSTDLPERPKSPWTPSYSVRRQGSGVFNEQKDDAKVESGAESLTDAPTKEEVPATKLVIRTGAEDIQSVQATSEAFPSTEDPESPGSLDTVGDSLSVAKDRKRLESTASSLFFPGGWFSPRPPAGRASLDNAQGEFTPSKSPVDEVPSIELESAPTSATAESDDSKEKKGKWCVIM